MFLIIFIVKRVKIYDVTFLFAEKHTFHYLIQISLFTSENRKFLKILGKQNEMCTITRS